MATIKFSEFDAGNINIGGAQLVGLTGGNSATNARFTAADLVNGLATITYVDSQDAGLQSQITQNTNDIAAIDLSGISANAGNIATLQGQVGVLQGNIVVLEGNVDSLENNVSVNQDDIGVLQGNVVSIEAELANINTDSQTLTYDGANANLSISNGNSVVLQEVLDNAGNITVIQGQISDLQANGNIQTLSLDNTSNVLSISAGNTVDFTTVLGNVAGSVDTDVFGTTISIANTSTNVYNRNGVLPADAKGMGVADPNNKSGWYWISPGPTANPSGLNSFQWKMFNNDGPQTFTVADIDYIYMIVDLYTVGQVYFNVYTAGVNPAPTAFQSRFGFTLNGDFASTGRFLMWAKPPGSTTTVDDVEVYPFLERLELPYDAGASSGPLLTSEAIKSVNVQTRSNPALTAGEVEFNLKAVGYKVNNNYIQNFDMEIYGGDQSISLDDSSNVLTISGSAGNNTVDFTTVLGNVAGGGNPFDQNLNTTDSPTFDNLSTTGELDVNGSGTHTFEGTLQFTQLTNFGGTVGITSILDEDDMVSDSATALATQQSIKAYVDANAGGGGIAAVVDDTSPELGGELNDGGFGIVMENGSPIESGIEFTNGSGTTFAKIETRPDSGDFVILGDDHNLVLRSFQDVELVTANDLKLKGLTWPASDGSAGQAIVTDGSGTLSFTTTFSLASLDVSNANITTNASTNSLDVQFDSKPVAKITSGVMVQVHGSWDASAGAAFSWATDEIASHGISNVTRDSAGIFTVTFETPFASDAYTATFGVGSTDYTGSGASPREVSLLSRTANSCQVICERSDDAVNEDNFYISLMICGVI